MTKLTETQTTILTAGAQRPDNIALPLPKGLAGAAAKMAVTKMIERGWLQEVDANMRRCEPLGAKRATATAPRWLSPMASLQGAADRLTSALTETREMIVAERANSAQLEARVRALENSATRQDTRFDALSVSINELKQQARETNSLLRELAQRP